MMPIIYFDNAATTKVCIESLETFEHYSRDEYFNASSAYTPAVKIEKVISELSKEVKTQLNINHGEMIYTSGGTESDNIAIIGTANKSRKKHIIISAIEHPAVYRACEYLKDERGYEVTILSVDADGLVSVEELKNAITDDTFLVSIIHVNNETGLIQPLKELCRTVKAIDKDILFHSDGVQAIGKINVNISDLGVDLYSLSSHKTQGPKGMGALYVKDKRKIRPISYGGGQQMGYRSGTLNHPGILAFNKAIMVNSYSDIDAQNAKEIKEYMIENITNDISDSMIISKNEQSFSPYILNVAFKKINAETLLHSVQYKGLIVSTGAACSSRRNVVSKTLKAMHVDEAFIGGAIRMSFSNKNTMDEAKQALGILKESINQLRKYTR
ncbi:MAG: cysteine desulfurase [Clostridiales bacterium]|nr:cysteine desulfurase [Clostridiales bacterium]